MKTHLRLAHHSRAGDAHEIYSGSTGATGANNGAADNRSRLSVAFATSCVRGICACSFAQPMKRIATLILLLLVGSQLCADEKKGTSAKQPVKEQANEAEAPPPKTLEEAHQLLEKMLPKEELAKIDAMKTEDEMIEFHFGLGRGLRNGWGLWGGGPLAQHMNKLGFRHPDDMSGVILETFWCRRHNKDYRLKDRAAYYDSYWKAVAAPPATAVDPSDGSPIEWSGHTSIDDPKAPRAIHHGKSKKTGRSLDYEIGRGVFVPSQNSRDEKK